MQRLIFFLLKLAHFLLKHAYYSLNSFHANDSIVRRTVFTLKKCRSWILNKSIDITNIRLNLYIYIHTNIY